MHRLNIFGFVLAVAEGGITLLIRGQIFDATLLYVLCYLVHDGKST